MCVCVCASCAGNGCAVAHHRVNRSWSVWAWHYLTLYISASLPLLSFILCVCVCVSATKKKKVAIRRGESDGRETSTIHVLYIVYVYNIDFAITYEGLRWLSFNDRSSLSPWWNMHMEVGSRMKQPRSSLYQIYHPYFICFLPMLVCSTFSFAFWIFFYFLTIQVVFDAVKLRDGQSRRWWAAVKSAGPYIYYMLCVYVYEL